MQDVFWYYSIVILYYINAIDISIHKVVPHSVKIAYGSFVSYGVKYFTLCENLFLSTSFCNLLRDTSLLLELEACKASQPDCWL